MGMVPRVPGTVKVGGRQGGTAQGQAEAINQGAPRLSVFEHSAKHIQCIVYQDACFHSMIVLSVYGRRRMDGLDELLMLYSVPTLYIVWNMPRLIKGSSEISRGLGAALCLGVRFLLDLYCFLCACAPSSVFFSPWVCLFSYFHALPRLMKF